MGGAAGGLGGRQSCRIGEGKELKVWWSRRGF